MKLEDVYTSTQLDGNDTILERELSRKDRTLRADLSAIDGETFESLTIEQGTDGPILTIRMDDEAWSDLEVICRQMRAEAARFRKVRDTGTI